MAAVQRVISLGLSARQNAKLNVRQPLAELVVSPGSDADKRRRRALPGPDPRRTEREGGAASRLGRSRCSPQTAKLNKKTAAAKLGPKLKEAEAALAKMTAAELDASPLVRRWGGTRCGPTSSASSPRRPGWAGVADKGTQVAINTTITEELKLEGLARVVIRQVQDTRKNAGLDLLDKIALHLQPGSDELAKAIKAHQSIDRNRGAGDRVVGRVAQRRHLHRDGEDRRAAADNCAAEGVNERRPG